MSRNSSEYSYHHDNQADGHDMTAFNDPAVNPQLGRIESANPCVADDTMVMTADGPRPITELVGKKCQLIVDGKTWWSDRKGFFKTGFRPVIKIEVDNGSATSHITLTPDHRVKLVESTGPRWVPAGDIKVGDRLQMNEREAMAQRNPERRKERVTAAVDQAKYRNHIWGNRLEDILTKSAAAIAEYNDNPQTKDKDRLTAAGVADLLRRDNKGKAVTLDRVLKRVDDPEIHQWFQQMLSWPEGHLEEALEQAVKAAKDLNTEALLPVRCASVTSTSPAGSREVYDVQVPGVNAFGGNGLLLHNCGNQPVGAIQVLQPGIHQPGPHGQIDPGRGPTARGQARGDG